MCSFFGLLLDVQVAVLDRGGTHDVTARRISASHIPRLRHGGLALSHPMDRSHERLAQVQGAENECTVEAPCRSTAHADEDVGKGHLDHVTPAPIASEQSELIGPDGGHDISGRCTGTRSRTT